MITAQIQTALHSPSSRQMPIGERDDLQLLKIFFDPTTQPNTSQSATKKPLYSNKLFTASLGVAGLDAGATILGYGGYLIAVSPLMVGLTVALPLFVAGAYFKVKAMRELEEDYNRNLHLAEQIYHDTLKSEIDTLMILRKKN